MYEEYLQGRYIYLNYWCLSIFQYCCVPITYTDILNAGYLRFCSIQTFYCKMQSLICIFLIILNKLYFLDQPETLVLLLGNNIEKLLINSLILSASIISLHPCVIPVGIQRFTAKNNPTMLHGKQRAISSESNLHTKMKLQFPYYRIMFTYIQARMKTRCQLCGKNSTLGHIVSI